MVLKNEKPQNLFIYMHYRPCISLEDLNKYALPCISVWMHVCKSNNLVI